jgi:hypothetical protein
MGIIEVWVCARWLEDKWIVGGFVGDHLQLTSRAMEAEISLKKAVAHKDDLQNRVCLNQWRPSLAFASRFLLESLESPIISM